MRPRRRALLLVVSLGYLFSTLLLGLRQFEPSLHALLHGSAVGWYSMFTSSVRATVTATLVGPRGMSMAVPYERYLWRNPLVSTTHSHLEPSVVIQFARFLADRPETRERLPAGTRLERWRVVVVVRYEKNEVPQIVTGAAGLR